MRGRKAPPADFERSPRAISARRTVQSGKLLFPQKILFAPKMCSQLFRDVPVQSRQVLVRRTRRSLEHPFDSEMVLIHHFDA